MDWIKQMSLRKSLFTLTFISIIAAFILSVAGFWGCIRLRGMRDRGIMIDPHTAVADKSFPLLRNPPFSSPVDWKPFSLFCLFYSLSLHYFTHFLIVLSHEAERTHSAPHEQCKTASWQTIWISPSAAPPQDELGQLCPRFWSL